MCPETSYKALLLQEGILRFELSWTAVWGNKNSAKKYYQKAVGILSMTKAQTKSTLGTANLNFQKPINK